MLFQVANSCARFIHQTFEILFNLIRSRPIHPSRYLSTIWLKDIDIPDIPMQFLGSCLEIVVLLYIDESHCGGQDDWLTLKIVVRSPVDGWRD